MTRFSRLLMTSTRAIQVYRGEKPQTLGGKATLDCSLNFSSFTRVARLSTGVRLIKKEDKRKKKRERERERERDIGSDGGRSKRSKIR